MFWVPMNCWLNFPRVNLEGHSIFTHVKTLFILFFYHEESYSVSGKGPIINKVDILNFNNWKMSHNCDWGLIFH
jgi:hypothetical protein